MSDTVSIIALIVAAGSFFFSVLSFQKSHSVEKRQLDIEEERRSEEKAAALVAYIHRDGNRRTLCIENKGNGEARNIAMLLDGRPLEEHPCYVDQPNSIAILGGQTKGHYIIVLTNSTPWPALAEVHWEDDVKKDNVSRSSLTV